MMKISKYILLILFLLNLNQQVQAKPVPPGSGEGDVPANILLLIDSSASMQRMLDNRDATESVGGLVYDTSGNIVMSQRRSLAVVRFDSEGNKDSAYNDNKGRWTGSTTDTCGVYSTGSGYTNNVTINTVVRHTAQLHKAENISTDNGAIDTEDIYFFRSHQNKNIMGISEDGQDCRFYVNIPLTRFMGFDIVEVGGEFFAFATGKAGRNARFVSVNLNTGEFTHQNLGRRGTTTEAARTIIDSWTMAVTSDASMMYLEYHGSIRGFALEKNGNTYRLSGDANPEATETFAAVSGGNLDTQLAAVTSIDISPDDDDILAIVSNTRGVLQKIELTGTTTYTVLARAGTGAMEITKNSEDSGTLAASSVRFWKPLAVRITTDRILVGSDSGTVDVFNEDLFNSTNKDTAWLLQWGGGRVSRWNGVKQAINAVLSDTTLTSGAHFGYGHWNSGETGGRKKSTRGGWQCHARLTNCQYYRGWTGEHPKGKSARCNRDSCLNVGVGPESYNLITAALNPQGLAWGTDANAFSQMALQYFTDPDVDIIDEHSDCQLNYVIVIGDGEWKHHFQAIDRIKQLRQAHGVKTISVAYGGGISARGLRNFDKMAIAGSCDDTTGASKECMPRITANTPEELKTELTAKIRQILAERLSFTAPSITATVQEGGSLYQAQFAYEQHGEWQGTILRKTLNEDGTVVHDMDATGNWSAAVEIRKQATAAGQSDTRNIWSAIPGTTYIGNWDNFNTDHKDNINEVFTKLGYSILDYHTATSNCSAVGQTGTEDEIEGLINFMKGTDFFDYDGDCNITEVRSHILGDIYHSQLIEVGSPDASLEFTDTNEEAYFRVINNYQNFQSLHSGRRDVIYAGSNSGMLHAINAETGKEEWGFIPPFIVAKLPSIINSQLDGKVDGTKGGTNAIFGVDGSPVVHDVYIKGLKQDGHFEDSKSWHTLLMIPYGRGGAGFSVLDITHPILKEGKGPLHMFSVFNDAINNKVLIADHEGDISEFAYSSGSANVSESLEGRQADDNLTTAVTNDPDDCDSEDGDSSTDCAEQDAIALCQTNADAASNVFYADGANTCYKGTTFTFEMTVPTTNGVDVATGALNVIEDIGGEWVSVPYSQAQMLGGQLVVTFATEKVYNPGGSHLETSDDNLFSISTSCTVSAGIEDRYNYTQLGETWSAPRIFRMPSDNTADRNDMTKDKYVAVMGGGMGNTNLCAGSAVFIVDLENTTHPGSIYGATINGGPITIVDTDPAGINIAGGDTLVTPNGSDIGNALPASAVVITPDTAFGIPWRGAMVYFNDLEGKITKLNLTSSTKNNAKLFDQTTLFRLNASTTNHRYSYFTMDAGIGLTTNNFWLFGGTGNFADIGGDGRFMDNILYGVKDVNYPFFKHLNGVIVPRETSGDFLERAHQGAENALSVDNAAICEDVTGDTGGDQCPTSGQMSWVIHLDTTDGLPAAETANKYRKLSASSTLFKGQVYFPIYQPPAGANKCNVGDAYICSADDECGSNTSHLLTKGGAPNGKECLFVREGILSELVVFGDTLFANVAGPKEDADTLYSVLSVAGEVESNRNSWRESGF